MPSEDPWDRLEVVAGGREEGDAAATFLTLPSTAIRTEST